MLAVGYPIGGEDISYTRGIVSRLDERRHLDIPRYLTRRQPDGAVKVSSVLPSFFVQP